MVPEAGNGGRGGSEGLLAWRSPKARGGGVRRWGGGWLKSRAWRRGLGDSLRRLRSQRRFIIDSAASPSPVAPRGGGAAGGPGRGAGGGGGGGGRGAHRPPRRRQGRRT